MRKESRIRNPESGRSPDPPGGGARNPESRRKPPAGAPRRGAAGGDSRDSGSRIQDSPTGTFEVACACGRKLLARREHVGKQVACSGCAKVWRLEKFRDPQTLETRLRVAPLAPKKAGPGPAARAALSGKGQDLLCVCGESLRVAREHLGRQAQCPNCGTLMRIEKVRDPQTQQTVVRAKVVGKADPPPQPADKPDWSLEDFR